MKKVWAVLLLLVAAGQVYADEGMWVLKELNKQNLARIKELGFVPSYQQLYSETDPCVANAVVIFGGGCRSAAAQKKCHTYKCCNQSFHLASCSSAVPFPRVPHQ